MHKKEILQFLIDQQQIAIEELKRSMDDFKDDADRDEDDTTDPEDLSQQVVAKESQMRLKQQLARAQQDLEILERFAGENFDTVKAGALLQTDKQWFLAGISLGGYDPGDIDVKCISLDSPAFKAILGKKVNDSFILGGTSYHIEAIY